MELKELTWLKISKDRMKDLLVYLFEDNESEEFINLCSKNGITITVEDPKEIMESYIQYGENRWRVKI